MTQLVGKRLAERRRRSGSAGDGPARRGCAAAPRPAAADAAVFVYDEWDHLIDDYRPAWCRLREIELPGDSGLFFDRALARHADAGARGAPALPARCGPSATGRVHGLEDGEVIDLNAVVDARVQRARAAAGVGEALRQRAGARSATSRRSSCST